jgi:integrase
MPLARQKGSQNWHCRRAGPKDLVEVIGKREIWRSLRTPDKHTAKRKVRRVEADIDLLFDRARAQATPASVNEVPEDALLRITRETFRSELARFDQDIRERPEQLVELLDYEADDLVHGLTTGTWHNHILEEIQERLAKAGYVLKGGTDWRAVQLLARAMVAAYSTASAHASGDWSFTYGDRLVTADLAPAGAAQGLTLRELIARFRGDPARAGMHAKSAQQYNTALRTLQEVVGRDTPANAVTREDCRQVRQRLIDKGLQASTISGYMTHVSTLMSWAQKEEYVDRNPARGLALKSGPHARDLKHPFSEAQLRRIFSARDWRDAKKNDPAIYFIPLTSLYGGLRITEACQLLTTDVRLQENIWIISVEPGPGKKLKSRAAQRIVPVHPDLIRLGFIEYARSRPEGQLFDLPTDSLAGPGGAFGKRFARFLKRVNADEPRTSFHSFRHVWRDMLKNAHVPEELAREVGGWSGRGASSLYGQGHSVAVLYEQICKLQPPVEIEQ